MAPSRVRRAEATRNCQGVQDVLLKASSCYVRSLKRLVAKLESEKAALEQAREQREWELERQKILVDFILCQEELERILAAQAQLLASADGLGKAELERINAATSASGTNWCNLILAAASLWCIQVVKQMGVEDWLAASNEGFKQLAVLLELANRELYPGTITAGDPDAHSNACGTSGNTAATAAAAAAGEHEQDTSAAAAAHSESVLLFDHLAHQLLAPIYVAMFYNPQPYYASAACNQATGKVQMAPPSHIQHVMQRLRLTPKQLLHLRIANTEFARLSRAASSVGDMLAERAAKLSLSSVTEEYQDDKAAAAEAVSGGQNARVAAAAADDTTPAAAMRDANPTDADATVNIQLAKDRQPGSSSADHSAGTAAENDAAGAPNTVASAAAAVANGPAVEAAAWRAAAADPEDGESPAEALSKQLDRYLGQMNIHTCVTAWLVVNTLTPRQVATFIAASYPFAPNVHALAEACMSYQPPRTAAADGEQQQQQQQQRHKQKKQAAGTVELPVEATWEQAWEEEVNAHMAKRDEQLQAQLQTWMCNALGLKH